MRICWYNYNFTGGFTSNHNLQSDAYNDLRNQVYKTCGNYAQMISTQAANTGSMAASGRGYELTNYSITASMYKY